MLQKYPIIIVFKKAFIISILKKIIKDLKNKALVLYLFLLMLNGMLNFIPDAFYKILRFSMIFLKKNFKFCPVQNGHCLISPFMLGPTVVNSFLEKCSYKQNIFGFHNIGHERKIFRLLAKLIAFHLGFLVIPV